MKNLWKILGLSLILVVSSLSFSACGDDDDGQKGKPKLFEEFETLYGDCELESANTSEDFLRAILKYQAGTTEINPLQNACAEYNTLRTKNKDWQGIIENNRNGAYYQALYIHLDALHDRAFNFTDKDMKALKALNDLFANSGCTTLMKDAEEATK